MRTVALESPADLQAFREALANRLGLPRIRIALRLSELAESRRSEHERQINRLLATRGWAGAALGALLLANMRFAWWEAALLFTLFATQFFMSGLEKPLGPPDLHNSLATALAGWLSLSVDGVEAFARRVKEVVTALYFIWAAIVLVLGIKRSLGGKDGGLVAITSLPRLMREHW